MKEVFVGWESVQRDSSWCLCVSFWDDSRACLRISICLRGEWLGESGVVRCEARQLRELDMGSEGG